MKKQHSAATRYLYWDIFPEVLVSAFCMENDLGLESSQRSHPSKRASSGRIKRALSCGSFSTCSPGWILLLVLVSSRKISLSTSPLPNATACTCVCRRQRTRLRDRPAVTDEPTDRHQVQKHTQESSISFCARLACGSIRDAHSSGYRW